MVNKANNDKQAKWLKPYLAFEIGNRCGVLSLPFWAL